jgi:hypothetical protein
MGTRRAMYISYFNNGIRYENSYKNSELRIHGSKIGSRFFSAYSDFTYDITSELEILPSINYDDNGKYDKSIHNFLLTNPYTTKMYAVVRNPKRRFITGIAQSVYIGDINIDLHSASMKLKEILDTDIHLNNYCDYLYHFITYHNHNNITKRLKYEPIIIEDLDEMKYYDGTEPIWDDNSNYKLYEKVVYLLDYIKNNKEFEDLQKNIDNYIESETNYYYKIKNNEKS